MPIYKIKLLQRETVANNTIKLTFEKPAGMTYQAGQYGGWTLINPVETDDHGSTRRFSFLSAPDDQDLTIVTRIQQSAYKRNLQNLNIGDEIKMAGPTGNFILHEDASIPAVLIAGGIGIAPFYSMIKYILKNRPDQKIYLFYGNQTLADSAFLDEFTTLTEQFPQFKMIAALTNPHPEWTGAKGYINDELLVKNLPDLDTPIFYACGSPGMVTAMQQMLQELQIPEERIKVEDFPGY